MTDQTMPTQLDEYAFVVPPEACALHNAFTEDGEPCLVLGFNFEGHWVGYQLEHAVVSDMTIELGRWFTDYVQARGAQQDVDDDQA